MNDYEEDISDHDRGIASNGSRCLSRTKSNASSFKSFKTFRTSSDDGFCYVPSHRDSGILIDCDMFKYEYFERQHKSHHLTSKRSGEPSHVPTSSFNQDQFDLFDMKDGAKGFEGKHFVRHDTPSTKPRQYPFAISNFLAKDYLGEHEESYDGKYVQDQPRDEGLSESVPPSNELKLENESSCIVERWKNFISRTTLHGIKYAFDDGPVRLRRIIWLVCIVSCVGIFVYQAMDRLVTYLQYPSNVNLKVVYTRNIEFPAVTICNYNKHRLTAVVDMNMYDFISQAYRPGFELYFDDIAGDDFDMNMTEFILNTSHQQNDFIVRCTWQGHPCNGSANFTQRMTDFGLCYTFNGDVDDRLRVVKAGSRSALGVILNVEQYEYMAGPDQETGIKILLHDPREFPQVRDLGFAVSPGMHVLVGVKRQCLENLQAPYGTCHSGAVARSQCLAVCTSNEVVERCGCRDPHMKPPSKYKDQLCSLKESFLCVRENSDLSNRNVQSLCECPNPCKMKTYDPLLSYARMSGVDFVDLDVDYHHVLHSYERARATFEKVDQASMERNKHLMERYFYNFHQLQENVTQSHLIVKHGDDNLKTDQQVLTEYLKNYSALSNDFVLTNKSFHDKVPLASKLQPDVSIWQTMVWDEYRGINAFLDIQGTFSGLLAILESCAEAERVSGGSPILPEDCDDEDESIRTYLFFRKNILVKWESIANESLLVLAEMKEKYEETLCHLFRGTDFEYHSNDTYLECMKIINDTVSFWLPQLEDLVNIQIRRYLTTNSWKIKLEISRNFESFYNLNKVPDNAVVQSRFDACQFFMKPIWFNKDYNSFLNYMNNANQAFLGQISLENSLLRQAGEVQKILNDSFALTSDALKDFFLSDGNTTKKDLCQLFHSEEVMTSETVKQLQLKSYLSDVQQLLIKISDVHSNVAKAYSYAFQLALPPLSDYIIEQLQLIHVARNVSSDDEYNEVNHWLSVLKSEKRSAIIGIIDVFYGKYVKVMRQVQGRLINVIQSFDSIHLELKADLRAYSELGKLDEDFVRENFIKVEIFYKELSYEHIQQQVSFQMLTLLSEIGGLLGLLLGASVLTLFEFIDFVVVLIAGQISLGCCRLRRR